MVDEAQLTATLEAALVRELRAAWRLINDTFFKSALAVPTFELVSSRTTLGRWMARTRTIEISRPLVTSEPWAAVLEVLKHEMVHQYVGEVLRETQQTAHGAAFRETCARLGVDSRASGVPAMQDDPRDRVVERIARLLALAESPNRHEAEAAMAAAQRLMLKYNIDTAAPKDDAGYGFAHVGRPTGRVLEHERLVAMILGKHFFVEAIWIPVYRPLEGKRGSVLEICGTRANLAIAEYVHGFLHQTAERLWLEHRKKHDVASNRERRSYLAGVMTGFADKLARHGAKSREEGLVWVGDGHLNRYFHKRHPHVRLVRHAGQRRTDVWARGREAGRDIVLYRPVEAASASRGRLLKG